MMYILAELGFGLFVIAIFTVNAPLAISLGDIRFMIAVSGLVGLASGLASGIIYGREYPIR